YGLNNKVAFSIGDTVTDIYSEVANVLKESGFTYTDLSNANTQGYIISINDEYQENIILSKKEIGTIDTDKGVLVVICSQGEKSLLAENIQHINLPYESPTAYEKTPDEKQKYAELNKQIASEMLYL